MKQRSISLILLAPTLSLSTAILACQGQRDGNETATSEEPVVMPGSAVFVSAHPDDDILFMSPDLSGAVAAGQPTRTVYVTSGDAGTGDPWYWQSREAGVQSAHAAMANVANNWNCADHVYAGKTALLCNLAAQPTQSLVFLRLLDGVMNRFYFNGPNAPAQSTVDGRNTYTATELVNTLRAIYADSNAVSIGMHDATRASGADHNDHVASAVYSLQAAQDFGQATSLHLYRGYNVYQPYDPVPQPESINLTSAEHDAKARYMAAYGASVAGNIYNEWCWRQYYISSRPAVTGPITTSSGTCLDVAGGSAVSGTAVIAATCSGSTSQTWSTQVDSTVRGIGGTCLTVASDNVSVQIATCNGSKPQRWTLLDNGQLQGSTANCLTLGANGSTVTVGSCNAVVVNSRFAVPTNQRWTQSGTTQPPPPPPPPPTPAPPVITAPSIVTSGTAVTVSVPARSGMTYNWVVTNGTITSGGAQGTTSNGVNSIVIATGTAGSVQVACTESDGTTTSTATSATINLVPAPVTPQISAISGPVAAGTTGLSASITARAGMTYSWSISGGTITSAGGSAGVLSNGINSVSFSAGYGSSVGLSCTETNSLGVSSPAAVANVSVSIPAGGIGVLTVAAHPVDELLFFNPDTQAALMSGAPKRTVYVTSGNGGGDTWMMQLHEEGVRSAYAAMAGVANSWSCGTRIFATKNVAFCTLLAMPQVTVAFLRLRDGQMNLLYSNGPSATPQSTDDGANTYSQADLINVLAANMVDAHPQRIFTHESTVYGADHPDNIASGALTLIATQTYGAAQEVRTYRGSNVFDPWNSFPASEPINLTQAQHDAKVSYLALYGTGVAGSVYDDWCWRQYSTGSRPISSAPVVASSGQCLGTNGASVVVVPCDGSVGQVWAGQTDATLQAPGGQCLTVAADGQTIQLSACASAASQKWLFFQDGRVIGQNNRCLTIAGTSVQATTCGAQTVSNRLRPAANQVWTH